MVEVLEVSFLLVQEHLASLASLVSYPAVDHLSFLSCLLYLWQVSLQDWTQLEIGDSGIPRGKLVEQKHWLLVENY